jgi:hypothetical protein
MFLLPQPGMTIYNHAGYMKQIFHIILFTVAVFLLAGTAGAIDRAKRDAATVKAKPPVIDTGIGADKPAVEKKLPDPKASRSKYDDFIDLNGNGVDDRAEKQGSAKPKREPLSDSTSVKPPKK